MLKPNPVVIDGNLFLNVFTSAILGNMQDRDVIHNGSHVKPMYRGRGLVIKSMVAMIFANAKRMAKMGYNPTQFCIVWDKRIKGKYHKSIILDKLGDGDTYKGDRKYVTAENLLDESLTQEERDGIEADIIKNRERYEARKFIETELPKFGIASYYYEGWEADDLDYIWAQETNKLEGSHIHYSGDSDWAFHMQPNDIFWQVNRAKLHLKTHSDVRTKHSIPEDMSLMEWAALQFSAFGSHNFLKRTFDPAVKRVTKKYKDKLFSGDHSDITDTKRFDAQRKCFLIEEFPNCQEVRDMYKTVISHSPTSQPDEFKSLLEDLGLGDASKATMYNSYKTFLKIILDSKLNQI